jgi:SAM-dependent methyltransferase
VARTSELHGPHWGARSREWAAVQEPTARPLYESVLDRLSVEEGTRVLDVGCGAGLYCLLASEQGAEVAGLDASEGMLEVARERTPAGDFRQGDIEELPWADASFDVVTGFNSFQFAGEPVNALREARRVVVSEGQVVVAVWGDPEECEAAPVLKALSELLPAPPPGSPGPFALSDREVLKTLVESAGLTPESVHDVPCPWVYPDLDTAVVGIGSAGPANRAEEEFGRESVEQAIARSLQPFGDGTGVYQLENVFRYVIARA